MVVLCFFLRPRCYKVHGFAESKTGINYYPSIAYWQRLICGVNGH